MYLFLIYARARMLFFRRFLQFAFAYIFNLILGVGGLALPRAFSESGLILGTLLITFSAFMGFMTTTYVVEAMAAANAYSIFREQEKRQKSTHKNSAIQEDDLVSGMLMSLLFQFKGT